MSAARSTCSHTSSAWPSASTPTSARSAYAGDCGLSAELVELARGCDVLLQMNHFFSGTEPSAAYRRACGNHDDNAGMAQAGGRARPWC